MKDLTEDPSRRDPKGIGHTFTDESRGELQVKKDDFLLPEEEERFQMMIERHGKAFAFSPQEIRCPNPKMIELMVIFTVRMYCVKFQLAASFDMKDLGAFITSLGSK